MLAPTQHLRATQAAAAAAAQAVAVPAQAAAAQQRAAVAAAVRFINLAYSLTEVLLTTKGLGCLVVSKDPTPRFANDMVRWAGGKKCPFLAVGMMAC